MNNTILKGVSILRLLAENTDGLTITEICKSLNLPKSTVFDIVHTFEQEQFLEVAPQRPYAFRLGLEAFRVGYSFLSGATLDSVARPILEKLSQRINETVFMASRSGNHKVVYLMKFLSDSELQTISAVGSVRHLLSVAMGKAILAALPQNEALAAVTEEMYATCSIPEIHDAPSLTAFLSEVRELGYVIDRTAENSHLVSPVAAPVLDIDGNVLGAVSIVAISDSKTPEQIHALGKMIQETALEISHRLGYNKDDLYAAARRSVLS